MSLKLTDVTVVDSNDLILKDISHEFLPGKIYILIGRTAAGKSSLMRTIAGLLDIDSGQVSFNGTDLGALPVWERKVSMVYQQFINYPSMSVIENVSFPLLRSGIAKEVAINRASEMIDKVGLTKFKERKPGELSGGQQQRVAIARALVRNADILLLDEPLMNLDYKLREQLREEFKDLFSAAVDSVVLYSTTEPSEAMLLGDEVLVMHEGKVIQKGKPIEIYESPNSIDVAQIFNDPPMSILSGKIDAQTLIVGSVYSTPLPGYLNTVTAGEYLVGIRPKDVKLVESGKAEEEGAVTLVEVSGSETFVYLDAPAGSFILQLEGIHEFHIGAKVGVNFDKSNFFIFGLDGKLVMAPGGKR